MISRLQGRPLIYGEVLFDAFPDGRKILGGAPFNVAWHLRGFGLQPLIVSRVGRDREGQSVLDAMERWALDASGIQHDDTRPTGAVQIAMDGTEHRFDIRPDQAYDRIHREPLDACIRDQSLSVIYHGSLIARDRISRETLEGLIAGTRLPVFLDVNLRDPWWSLPVVESLLQRARWAKLNDDELGEIAPGVGDDLQRAAGQALSRFGLEAVVVTRGAEGAFIATDGGTVGGSPPRVDDLVDTVGAGDAFCAVTLFGLHAGWSPRDTVERALAFASAVCEQRGAISSDRELYARTLASWGVGQPA